MAALFLAAYVAVILAGLALKLLNFSHLRRYGHVVPPELEGYVDAEVLKKTAAYNTEHGVLGTIVFTFDSIVTILFLFTGAVAVYDGWISSLTGSLILGGVLFFIGLSLAESVLGVPFSLWANFVIEERYGFNRKTFGIWLGDTLKSLLLGLVMYSALFAGALSIMQLFPDSWWWGVWALFMLFYLLILFIAPFMLRLFFKFKPIEGHDELEEAIRSLAERAGLRLKGIFKIDSSKKTAHSNAFFTGMGSTKTIALFDTLIEKVSTDEIVAVLAHEVGHWKLRHSIKRLAFTAVLALAALFVTFQLLRWGGLPRLIGLEQSSIYVQFVVLSLMETIVSFPLEPLRTGLSRRNERQADRFAARITRKPEVLASALAKLSRDNLSNLHPHPIFVAFRYSHPPDVERIRNLNALAAEGSPEA